MRQKKFTEEELKTAFQHYGLGGDMGLAVKPNPTKTRLVAFALEKSGDAYSVIEKTVIPASSPDMEVEFLGREGVGEILLPRTGTGVRYDVRAHEWIFVSWRRWANVKNVHPDPDKAAHLPATFAEIAGDYFPQGKRKENFWRTFMAKNGDGFFNIAESGENDSAFIFEAKDGQCVVYACIRGPESVRILSVFSIPKEYGFPLRFRANFRGYTGVFSVNDQLYGTYDFNALTGEALSLPGPAR